MSAVTGSGGAPPLDITQALLDFGAGDPRALDRLFPMVCEGMRAIARARLRSGRGLHALAAPALVREAWLALIDQSRVQWRSRSHFFATASLAMRRILVDTARARASAMGGQGSLLAESQPGDLVPDDEVDRVLLLDSALDRLSAFNPKGAEIVVCRLFGGLDLEETAEALGLAPNTVRSGWASASGWLRRELDADEPE